MGTPASSRSPQPVGDQGGLEGAEEVVARGDLERAGLVVAERVVEVLDHEVAPVDAALGVAVGEVGLDALEVAVEDAGAEGVAGPGADRGERDLVVGDAGDTAQRDEGVALVLAGGLGRVVGGAAVVGGVVVVARVATAGGRKDEDRQDGDGPPERS